VRLSVGPNIGQPIGLCAPSAAAESPGGRLGRGRRNCTPLEVAEGTNETEPNRLACANTPYNQGAKRNPHRFACGQIILHPGVGAAACRDRYWRPACGSSFCIQAPWLQCSSLGRSGVRRRRRRRGRRRRRRRRRAAMLPRAVGPASRETLHDAHVRGAQSRPCARPRSPGSSRTPWPKGRRPCRARSRGRMPPPPVSASRSPPRPGPARGTTAWRRA